MQASRYGYVDVVELLLEQKGIIVRATNSDGDTARMLASDHGHFDVVVLFIEFEYEMSLKKIWENVPGAGIFKFFLLGPST